MSKLRGEEARVVAASRRLSGPELKDLHLVDEDGWMTRPSIYTHHVGEEYLQQACGASMRHLSGAVLAPEEPWE